MCGAPPKRGKRNSHEKKGGTVTDKPRTKYDYPIDTIQTIPCLGCGKPLSLTWTHSASGGAFHGSCYEKYRQEKTLRGKGGKQ
nr:MAG TPA: hypothetical protein [Caudoviricetes sp.]